MSIFCQALSIMKSLGWRNDARPREDDSGPVCLLQCLALARREVGDTSRLTFDEVYGGPAAGDAECLLLYLPPLPPGLPPELAFRHGPAWKVWHINDSPGCTQDIALAALRAACEAELLESAT